MFKILFLAALLGLFCLSALQTTPEPGMPAAQPLEHIEMAAGFGGPPNVYQR